MGGTPKIGGKPPKSAILIGFSIINPSILGVLPVFLGSHPCDLMIQNWYENDRRVGLIHHHVPDKLNFACMLLGIYTPWGVH